MSVRLLDKAVARWKNGDADAFEYIYDNTYKVVFFVAHSILKNRTYAQDIVQETYLRVFRDLKEREISNFTAYLTTVAKNLAINEYNKNKRISLTDEGEPATDTHFEKQEYGLISAAQKLLDETDYKIVVMCVIAGYKRREASKILGIPVSTVSYRLKTALQTLKKFLEECDS